MAGDLSPCDKLTQRYNEIDRSGFDANIPQGYASQQLYRQIELDRSKEIVPLAARFAAKNHRVSSWLAALAWIQWDGGFTREARATLLRFRKDDMEEMAQEPGGSIGLAGLCEVAASLAHERHCTYLIDILSPLTNRAAIAGYGVVYFGSIARYVGLLKYAQRDYKSAEVHLRSAITHETTRGATIWKGHNEVDLAHVLAAASASRGEVQLALADAQNSAAQGDSLRLIRRIRSAEKHLLERRMP
jgi:hypothetical protein